MATTPKVYGFGPATAAKLLALSKESPPNAVTHDESALRYPAGRSYLVQPLEEVPAVSNIEGHLHPGVALARFVERDEDHNRLQYRRDTDDDYVDVDIYNYHQRSYSGSDANLEGHADEVPTLLWVAQDMWGDLFVIAALGEVPSSVSSSSSSRSSGSPSSGWPSSGSFPSSGGPSSSGGSIAPSSGSVGPSSGSVGPSSGGCNTVINDINDLPILDPAAGVTYVLGVDANGCPGLIPIQPCVNGSSA